MEIEDPGNPHFLQQMPRGGRNPVINGQVLFLLVGAAVAFLAVVQRCQGEAGMGSWTPLWPILLVSCPSVVCRSAWPGLTALFHFCCRKHRASGLWGS